jgi:BirA family biotin operon repressor/biotin-[acetyl-CoA-carboxylase] ligase
MNASCISLLRILSDGGLHSEDALARALGLSREGVLGRVRAIEALGLRVSRARKGAYRLEHDIDLLDADALARRVDRAFVVEVIDECTSTNSLLAARAAAGAAHGLVIACEHQSAGRGRRGNTWIGSLGGGLAFSILWRFPGGAQTIAGLSLAVAVGAALGLERQGVRGVGVKWPNDLYIGDSKLGGILVEASGSRAGPSAAVIGVGLNVRLDAATRERIGRPVADVASHGDVVPKRTDLLVALLESLRVVLERFSREGFAPFREEWVRRHVWQGRRAALLHATHRVSHGKVAGVAEDGALMLTTDKGTEKFHSGELSLRVE